MDLDFHVHIKTSNLAIRVMLAQNPVRKCDQPIAYVFHLLNNMKHNYTIIKYEALAMVYTLHKFWHYLLGNKFVFYVDHMAMLYLIKKPQTFRCITTSLFYSSSMIFGGLQIRQVPFYCKCFIMTSRFHWKQRSIQLNLKCYPFHIITHLVIRCAWLPINRDLYDSFVIGAK